MKQAIATILRDALAEVGVSDVLPVVSISEDASHGDYTSNIAMRLASAKGRPASGRKQSPMDIALQVQDKLKTQIANVKAKLPDQKMSKQYQNKSPKQGDTLVLQDIDRIEVVPPGFINIFLTEAKLSSQVSRVLRDAERYGTSQTLVPLELHGEADGAAKRIMVEFAHPNTHKAFHIGHLRNITTGECLVRILEATGHEVIRANYQGDVGMHIAKCLWAMKHLSEFDPAAVRVDDIHVKVEFLGKAYAAGSTRYEADETVKKEVGEINKQIYAKDPAVYPIYQETRGWSLQYFAMIYERVGTHYDRLYFEGETYESGKQAVLEGLKKGIFEKSDCAIIFPGEKYARLAEDVESRQGLHNRVFITKEGNATYEGKDMGLAPLQHAEYHPDLIMHVLGPEQYSYTRVIFKALDLLFPETARRQFHKTYGWVKLKHGKMSSRTGQVVLGEWLLDEAKKSIYEILDKSDANYASSRATDVSRGIAPKYSQVEKDDIAEKASIAAVKYAFLRVSTDQEIAFDLKESVSFDGDSGPYLLYTYARCKSVLRKAGESSVISHQSSDRLKTDSWQLNAEERILARLISFFPEMVEDAAHTLSPNVLCSYLFRLAQAFNLFYQKHPIIEQRGASSVNRGIQNKDTDTRRSTLDTRYSNFRLALTAATAQVMKNGLSLLGISTVERM